MQILETYTEFYKYDAPSGGNLVVNLVFENPIFISFFVTGPSGSTMYLNNTYKMAYVQPVGLSQVNSLQNYLEIVTPNGTVDKTKYTLQLFPQTTVYIVVRFYNNNANIKIAK
jgi:hypothetical protein